MLEYKGKLTSPISRVTTNTGVTGMDGEHLLLNGEPVVFNYYFFMADLLLNNSSTGLRLM